MSEYQEINSILQKSENITRRSFILTGLTTSKCASKFDLKGLLELLTITNEVNLQLKVFSALSAYLLFNKGANIDVIIKCNAVYDKINNVLSMCLPRRSTEALNFLSTLLYINTEEDSMTKKRALALYARNMTRVSGCLCTMCEMFSNCMMYHDTWKSLCQCLAVACSQCEINQSYCSHLIPVCIQKCTQVNLDVFKVLQSLMLNHSRNVQLFLDCNGVSIFTRELLHYDTCLQLLTIVVQNSNIISLLQQTNVLKDLHDFLRLYGRKSQLGQKAIIILNYISPRAKGKETQQENLPSENKIHANTLSSIEININTKETEPAKDANTKTENDLDETKVLIQNVMKEIFKWKQSEMQNRKKAESILESANRSKSMMQMANKQVYSCKRKPVTGKTTNTLTVKSTNKTNEVMNQNRRNQNARLHYNKTTDLSFSFLQNDDFKVPNQQTTIEDTQSNDTTFYEKISNAKNIDKAIITIQEFKPVFASTPKHTPVSINDTEATRNSCSTSEVETKQNKFKKLKMKRQKAKKKQQKEKDIKNCSLSARFFGAINDSCTTFVKTVKNIFNKKETPDVYRNTSSNTTATSHRKDKRPSSYSFINYMRKRDAVLKNNWMRKNPDRELSIEANSCKTCDNTEVLKQKLTKDEFLRQTVKKLKFGINLYGCDFKKISKTMWPQESYMTPLVLYNLYRKLLIK